MDGWSRFAGQERIDGGLWKGGRFDHAGLGVDPADTIGAQHGIEGLVQISLKRRIAGENHVAALH